MHIQEKTTKSVVTGELTKFVRRRSNCILGVTIYINILDQLPERNVLIFSSVFPVKLSTEWINNVVFTSFCVFSRGLYCIILWCVFYCIIMCYVI